MEIVIMKKVNILGINLSKLAKPEVMEIIKEYLGGEKQHYLVTPNPEIILEAAKDEEFFYILNMADLSVLDGFGLKLATWASGSDVPRITGADLVHDVLDLAVQKKYRVAAINWQAGLSTALEIKTGLIKKFPGLEIEVFDCERDGSGLALEKIKTYAPRLLLVTLGAPWQEKFIYRNLSQLPSVKLAMGIGGALDFLTGKAKRAPKLFRFLGIEWLWRMFQQKKIPGRKVFFFNRIKRVYRAVVVFSFKYFVWRFVLPFLYRQNVVCMLYKQDADGPKVLLVERVYQPGHWQLPQGGTDCEDLFVAGVRELSEELNVSPDKFKPVAAFKKLWKYTFKKHPGKYMTTGKYWGYRGQEQGLLIAEFSGTDDDIKINFWEHSAWRWVKAQDVVKEVDFVRKDSARIFLEKFFETIKSHEIKN